MSAIQTYALRCDGCGTIIHRPDLRLAGEIRAAVASEGWRHALVDRGQGPASSYDFCLACTVPGDAVERPRQVLVRAEDACYLRALLRALLAKGDLDQRETATGILDSLERGLR